LEKFYFYNNVKRTLLFLAFIIAFSSVAFSQNAGTAGVFARFGFGARGMAMGNAMTAVSSGDISSYYNPALSAFSEHRTIAGTFSILSLDRYLNFFSYTQAIKPTAGVSVGLINFGVKNIDGRDNDGVHTDDLSTTENQFYLAFSNKIDPHVSLGVAVKLYYSKLFEEIKSTTVGFDVGAYVQATDQLAIGAIMQDINSKYKWDTKSLYGAEGGKTTEDKFPTLKRIAVSYTLPSKCGVVSVEFESSSMGTNILRCGAEYSIVENFTLRSGLDRLDFSDQATGAKPTFGFTLKNSFNGWTPAVTYAYVFESFAPRGMHIITLSTAL
jgi:hypothetical protein